LLTLASFGVRSTNGIAIMQADSEGQAFLKMSAKAGNLLRRRQTRRPERR
jgi:hypothetical protein